MKTSSQVRISQLTEAGLWGSQTLHELLFEHARTKPDALAVKDQPDREALTGDEPKTLSWAELAQTSVSLAAQLREHGVLPGQTLLVQLPNVVELLVVYYAASQLGVVVSPVPVQYGRHELEHLAKTLNADTMLSMGQLREAPLAARAAEALPDCRVLVFGRDLEIRTDATNADAAEYDAEGNGDANSILTVCWTSGTTGTPKGVPRSHNMWFATARCTARAGGMQPEDVLLNPFPLVNMAAIGGFVFPAALLGCAIVLHHPLDPTVYLQQVQDENVTFTIAPPALLNQLAKTPALWNQFDFSALRRIGSGSAPLAPWMVETFSRDYGKEIVNFYGSNEGISLFATPESAPEPDVRAAMFTRPSDGDVIETRVEELVSGTTVTQAGASGELLIRGATVFDGYYEHNNADVFTEDGFFRTGDLVEICGDKDDCYRIVGRCKDIINRGGMKISPQELDVALESHPALAEAAVCAYPDERLGEKICACVVVAQGETAPTLDGLRSHLEQQGFASFKLPERLEVFDQLPRNPLGKVQRFSLEEAVS